MPFTFNYYTQFNNREAFFLHRLPTRNLHILYTVEDKRVAPNVRPIAMATGLSISAFRLGLFGRCVQWDNFPLFKWSGKNWMHGPLFVRLLVAWGCVQKKHRRLTIGFVCSLDMGSEIFQRHGSQAFSKNIMEYSGALQFLVNKVTMWQLSWWKVVNSWFFR